MEQKVGANPRVAKAYEQLIHAQASGSEEEAANTTMLFKKNCIAGGATVKWKRTFRDEELEESPGGEAETQDYTSRRLACTRCGGMHETSWMQLRTSEGFRAVHCKICRLQERCLTNKCQCGVIWHQCQTHRIDPREHWSKKAPKKSPEERARCEELRREETKSKRKTPQEEQPPDIEEGREEIRRKRGVRREQRGLPRIRLKPMKRAQREVKPNADMLARIKEKVEKKAKAERHIDDDCIPCGRCDSPADCQLMCGDCDAVWCNECTTYITCTTCNWPICASCQTSHQSKCTGGDIVAGGVEADPSDLQLQIQPQQRKRKDDEQHDQQQQELPAAEIVTSRKRFEEMLKCKVLEQAAQAAKQRRTMEAKGLKQVEQPAKPDQPNSREGPPHDIRGERSECKEDQMQILLIKDDTIFNAAYDHDPQLPGIKGQTEAIYGRMWSRADKVFNATYELDPQLPGMKSQTEAINKRLWSESRGHEAEAGTHRDDQRPNQDAGEGPPIKRLKGAIKKVHFNSKKNKKDEMDAITRLVRANNGRSERVQTSASRKS